MSLETKNHIHAAGQFSGATPPVVGPTTGNWSVERIAAGIWDVTLQDAIDPAERVIVAIAGVISVMVSWIPANDTDTVFRLHAENDASADTDAAINFMVLRVKSGS